MQDRVEKLLGKCGPGEKIELTAVYNAYVGNLNKLNQNQTTATIKDFDAAKKSLAELVASLEEKYFNQDPAFPSRKDALLWLQGQGYKIKKSKFYLDAKKGVLRFQADGSVRQSDLKNYIVEAEIERATDESGNLTEDMAQKIRLENKIKEKTIRKMDFEHDLAMGSYVRISVVETEMAIKAAAFMAGMHNTFRIKIAEIIDTVRGDHDLAPALVKKLDKYVDDLMDEYSRMDVIRLTV
jgi:hypothetical protein